MHLTPRNGNASNKYKMPTCPPPPRRARCPAFYAGKITHDDMAMGSFDGFFLASPAAGNNGMLFKPNNRTMKLLPRSQRSSSSIPPFGPSGCSSLSTLWSDLLSFKASLELSSAKKRLSPKKAKTTMVKNKMSFDLSRKVSSVGNLTKLSAAKRHSMSSLNRVSSLSNLGAKSNKLGLTRRPSFCRAAWNAYEELLPHEELSQLHSKLFYVT